MDIAISNNGLHACSSKIIYEGFELDDAQDLKAINEILVDP